MPDGSVMNTLLLLGIAAFNALTAVVGWYTLRSAKRAEANIQTVEEATNSMKDALVAATAKASFAEGKQAERENPHVTKGQF